MEKLWLIWKNPLESSRRRYTVGELTAVFDNGKKNPSYYTFEYTNPELEEAKKEGFEGFVEFGEVIPNEKIKSNVLFPTIAQRLPDPIRADYLDILNNYDLDLESTEWEILKATKGRLRTDTFEFVPVFDENKIEFELAGSRHRSEDFEECKRIISDNDILRLKLEEENPKDPNAVKVIYKTKEGKELHIGYVPRYYAKNLHKILQEGKNYSAMVSRVRREHMLNNEDFVTVRVRLIMDNKKEK